MRDIRLKAAAMTLIAIGAAGTAQPRDAHAARPGCAAVVRAVATTAVDVSCFESPDLTTNSSATTPEDNSEPGLPPFAFTPRTDRQAISPDAPHRTPIAGPVPGIQVAGTFKGDPQARFVLRLPSGWNGRLVTGAPSAVRSEYGLDYAWSDYVVQRGFAYVASNKGMLNARLTTPLDPQGCALSAPGGPQSAIYVRGYLLDRENTLAEWSRRTIQATGLARRAALARYGRRPARTYLVGVSAGGWTVRHLLERHPRRFDGGIDWEGALFTAKRNILRDFVVALRHWPAYRASLFSAGSAAHRAMTGYGFPPDMLVGLQPQNIASPLVGSYYETQANAYWHLLGCLVQKELDPDYRGELAEYDYDARDADGRVSARAAGALTEGGLRRPLISVGGTMDALTLMETGMRVYRDLVVGAGRGDLHRLYEVQNGSHVDRHRQSTGGFEQLEFVQPHAQSAFERLVDWVERGMDAPAGQCIPRGGAVVDRPAAAGRPEHCARLLVP